ncbi:S8 family serine peptidase [Leucobacter sp. NPDC058333]|uniref:S8 family peptidase n=1 Tax=Leucobacter sp. NPDC058333 TaxID=3346450 RepID=UPI003650CA6F
MKTKRNLILAALLTLTSLSVSASAGAVPLKLEESRDGLWYTEWLNYDGLAANGATGEGVKIAVIDRAVDTTVPELEGANVEVKGSVCADPDTKKAKEVESSDPSLSSHGTNSVAMIVGNGEAEDGKPGARGIAPRAEVWFYGVGDIDDAGSDCLRQDPTVPVGGVDLSNDIALGTGTRVKSNADGHGEPTSLAARVAIRDGADIVSISFMGGASDWDQVLIEAQMAGVIVVSSTDNPDSDQMIVGGPWETNGAVPVASVDSNGDPFESPSSGESGLGSPMLAFAAPGVGLLGVGNKDTWGPELITGTSYATPIVAGALALGIQKHPNASRFQVLQALIRTTDDGVLREPEWFGTQFGYGYVNPTGMLEVDPSQFPDVNPQFVTDIKDSRCKLSDGSAGTIDDSGTWQCGWSSGPFPPQLESYEKVVKDGAPVLNDVDELVASPYSEASPTDGVVSSPSVGMVIGIGSAMLLIIAAGVAVPLIIWGNRKRSRRVAAGSNSGGGISHE